jgi:hypothetical protein
VHEANLPQWERQMIDDAIGEAETRLEEEKAGAARRALQLAREQGYHRLAVAIDRGDPTDHNPAQLRLWGSEPTLFDEAG